MGLGKSSDRIWVWPYRAKNKIVFVSPPWPWQKRYGKQTIFYFGPRTWLLFRKLPGILCLIFYKGLCLFCYISDWLIDVDRNGNILRNMLLFRHYWWPACTSGHAIRRDAVDNSLVLDGPLSHFVCGNYSLSKNILCTKLMNNYLERLTRSQFWKEVLKRWLKVSQLHALLSICPAGVRYWDQLT